MTYRLPLKRRIFKHPAVQAFASWLIAYLVKLVWHSFRKAMEVHPEALPYINGEKNGIFCFWHGRMILLPLLKPKNKDMHVLISQHRDGELIARVIRHFGIDAVRGSSSKGAREAVRAMKELLGEGHNISITPDGPRGPARQAAKGAAMMAKISGLPLIPVTFSAFPCKRNQSWDGFMIPKPFSHVVVLVGAPLFYDDEAAESMHEKLAERLNDLTDSADARVGLEVEKA